MKTILTLTLVLFISTLFAQPSCDWAYIPIGATQTYNNIYNSTIDHSGNLITLGMILGGADMDPASGVADTSFSNGGYNFYISKTSPAGNLIWIHYFQDNSQISQFTYRGLKVNSLNEIVVAGNYTGMIDFDFSSTGVDTLRSHFPTYTDYFVAKYDSAGNHQWAFNIGDPTTNNIDAFALTILPNDNIVIAGTPNGTIDVDPGSGVHNTIGGNGNLICYDANGNYVWNNNISATYSYGVPNNSLDADGLGNTYFATVGYYELTINKFDIYGNQLGNFTLGDFSNQARVTPQSILSDRTTGDIYISGTYGGTVDFDPSSGIVNKISSSGFFEDGFIAKYDQNLNLIWVNTYIGETNFGDYSLDFDGTDIVAAGSISGTIDFGNGIVLTANTSMSPFYVKINSNGITQSGYIIDGYGKYNTLHTGINNTFATTGTISGSPDLDPSAATLTLTASTSTAFTAFYKSPNTTSIIENKGNNKIIAYPIPANNFIALKIDNSLLGTNYIIRDIIGRELKSGILNNETTKIDLSELSRGMYIVQIANISDQTIRFVKE